MESHTHPILWIVVLMLCFNAGSCDCSGDRTRLENRVRSLETRLQTLENTCGK